MDNQEEYKVSDSKEVDRFMNLNKDSEGNLGLYKLLVFPNGNYGVSVTNLKQVEADEKSLVNSSNEMVVTFGNQKSITDLFEKLRASSVNDVSSVVEDMNRKVKQFELNVGDQIKGIVKDIKSVIQDGEKRIDVVISNSQKTFVLRVKSELQEKFKIGQSLAISRTTEGLAAKISQSPKIANQLKMT